MSDALKAVLEDDYALFSLVSVDGEFVKVAKYDKAKKRFWWFNEPGGKYKYGIMLLSQVGTLKVTRGKYGGEEFDVKAEMEQ